MLVLGQGIKNGRKAIIRLGTDKNFAVDVEDGLAENAALAANVVQRQHGGNAVWPIVTRFKLGLVGTEGYGRIHVIIPVRPPQIGLVGKEVFMGNPKQVRVLLAHAFGRERGVNAGVAMIEHRPKNKFHPASFYVVGNDLWLCA